MTNFYEDGPDDILILIHNASRFVIYVFPLDTSDWKQLTTEEMANLLQGYIRQGMEKAYFSKDIIATYFEQSGETFLLKNQGRKRTACFTVATKYILSRVTRDPEFQEREEQVDYLANAVIKIEKLYSINFEYFQTLLEEEFGQPVFDQSVFDLEVHLDTGVYPVRRLLRMPARITLADLHLTLQRALGWENSHLYQFDLIKKVRNRFLQFSIQTLKR